jgi:hypothetical protein
MTLADVGRDSQRRVLFGNNPLCVKCQWHDPLSNETISRWRIRSESPLGSYGILCDVSVLTQLVNYSTRSLCAGQGTNVRFGAFGTRLKSKLTGQGGTRLIFRADNNSQSLRLFGRQRRPRDAIQQLSGPTPANISANHISLKIIFSFSLFLISFLWLTAFVIKDPRFTLPRPRKPRISGDPFWNVV